MAKKHKIKCPCGITHQLTLRDGRLISIAVRPRPPKDGRGLLDWLSDEPVESMDPLEIESESEDVEDGAS